MEVGNNKKSADGYLFGLWGLIMHSIVLWGVLDANFHSPILNNLPTVPPLNNPPAKRLFLFVADGLRYRTFAEETPPYLKNVMENIGIWGISHTRMPTESRPGNVAIAAGLYEDPSALFKGWKENPVNFDSVFNQSKFTWAWGSPDIIPMFVKGSRQNIHGESYPHHWQDFDKSTNSSRLLDSWVFNKYFTWLNSQTDNIKNQNGIIVFFHLLGCDTAGHASKPHSKEYKDNMRFVDKKIQEVVESTTKYFNDNSTAYIFTADHGMTDWGSHGSGSNDETETPMIAWGAGVNYYKNNRHDIEQADIAPLISSLLGISIPVNNEGVLPRLYLESGNDEYGAKALLNNINQLTIQVKANRILSSGRDDVTNSNWRERKLDIMINKIKNLLREKKFDEAIKEGDEAIYISKETLSHYRKYQRNQLVIFLTLMWLGWIILLILNLTGVKKQFHSDKKSSSHLTLLNIIFITAVILLLIEHKVSGRGDWRVMGYGTIAFTSLWLAARSAFTLSPVFRMKDNKSSTISIVGTVLIIMTMSAGLINRLFFSLSMIICCGMQIILMKNAPKFLIGSAIALSVYPTLPLVKPNPQTEIVLISLALAVFILWKQSRHLVIMELIKIFITCLIVTENIDGRNGLSWIILIISPICIFLYSTENIETRLKAVTVGLLCPLALLSASYEPQVYLLLGVHLISLVNAMKNNEHETLKHNEELLTPENLMTAAYFMLYILLSFFGTGNMASISSFDPMWTRHFITVFSPFTMSGLILLKLAIPLILVGCASRAFASSSMFMAVLLLGDCLSLPLMYNVTSEGSWLDIGTAISRYTITITFPCLFLILYHLSSPLMTFRFGALHAKAKTKHHLV
ncbi:hypothetical protein PV325_002228 [Microctonus aethiopoides]|uniref:GPI ethanolamine phosphate transferase 1 n=1 Tax=Microctonus aethiopoides TaxID=144406 RepID=A0AA39F6Y4_9HYME|nr:hypothetical protein PV325_002228 [Microctonus aethiopoides]KAK0164091.1 hypothetical protein PV328_002757 [Microctonus aethiopoides]